MSINEFEMRCWDSILHIRICIGTEARGKNKSLGHAQFRKFAHIILKYSGIQSVECVSFNRLTLGLLIYAR